MFQSTRALLRRILKNQEKIMSGISDLKQAVADIATNQQAETDALTAEFTAIDAAIAKLQAGGLSDADAETLAQQLQASVGNMKTATGNLTAETTKLTAM